jgi:hypothetical protein
LGVAGLPVSLYPSPSPQYVMPPLRNFVGTLAVLGKTFKEIEGTVKTIYDDKGLKKPSFTRLLE